MTKQDYGIERSEIVIWRKIPSERHAEQPWTLRTVAPVPLRQRREASAIAGATGPWPWGRSAANASSAIVTGAATHDLRVDVDL